MGWDVQFGWSTEMTGLGFAARSEICFVELMDWFAEFDLNIVSIR